MAGAATRRQVAPPSAVTASSGPPAVTPDRKPMPGPRRWTASIRSWADAGGGEATGGLADGDAPGRAGGGAPGVEAVAAGRPPPDAQAQAIATTSWAQARARPRAGRRRDPFIRGFITPYDAVLNLARSSP